MQVRIGSSIFNRPLSSTINRQGGTSYVQLKVIEPDASGWSKVEWKLSDPEAGEFGEFFGRTAITHKKLGWFKLWVEVTRSSGEVVASPPVYFVTLPKSAYE